MYENLIKYRSRHISGNRIYISHVFKYVYDKKYILIASAKSSLLKCKRGMRYAPFAEDIIEFVIINKSKNTYFSTTNRHSFFKMKNKFNITLKLSLDDKDMKIYKQIVTEHDISKKNCTLIQKNILQKENFHSY